MAGSQFVRDLHAICPYYKRESAIDIKCDSICSFARSTTLNFETKLAKEDYKDDFCNGLYQSCILYQVLEEEC